jgi:hypothetical protein
VSRFWLASRVWIRPVVKIPSRVKVSTGLRIPVGRDDLSLRPMMWMFLAILVTFIIARIVTRLIRSGGGAGAGLGNVRIAGHHVHHQVLGILVIIGTGIALVSQTPRGTALDAAAAVFGVVTGVTGIVIGLAALVGAIRLAKPGSWWAVHRYASRPRRAGRAASRYGQRHQERWNRLRDLVAGAPTLCPPTMACPGPVPARPGRSAATRLRNAQAGGVHHRPFGIRTILPNGPVVPDSRPGGTALPRHLLAPAGMSWPGQCRVGAGGEAPEACQRNRRRGEPESGRG